MKSVERLLNPAIAGIFCALLLGAGPGCAVNFSGGTDDGTTGDSCDPSCPGVTCGQGDGCGGVCEPGSGCCAPDCDGKVCGVSDGCGGVCQLGSGCTCDTSCEGKICNVDDGCGNVCEPGSGCCTPSCADRRCGEEDGCGGICLAGSGCCEPDCEGKDCGAADGCGGVCQLGSGCTCVPSCEGKICNQDDGCGNVCEPGSGCCEPGCAGVTCGEGDGCGGTCLEGSGCCTPDCSDKRCGQDDGCGGTCQPGSGCCEPACAGVACGATDGCGGTCQAGSGCYEPLTQSSAEYLGRGLVAMPRGSHAYLSWRLLPRDTSGVGFNVYRRTGGGSDTQVNGAPITTRTSFLDITAASGTTYTYHVRTVDSNGVEGPASNPFQVTAGTSSYIHAIPLRARTDAADVFANQVAVGDINGDGVMDFVVVMWGGYAHSGGNPTYPQHMEALLSQPGGGWASAWRVSSGVPGGETPTAAVILWDLDGDGRAEIVARWGAGGDQIAVLDPATGVPLDQATIPSGTGAYFYATFLVMAYLEDADGDGFVDPFIVTQSAMGEPRFAAFSYDPTVGLTQVRDAFFTVHDGSDGRPGFSQMGTHGLPAADLDGDGLDEVIPCGSILTDDWSSYWVVYPSHADVCYPADIDPARAGPELLVGGDITGYLTKLPATGGPQVLWTVQSAYTGSREGWDKGWAADIDPTELGMEVALMEESEEGTPGDPYDNLLVTRVFTAGSGADISSRFSFKIQYDSAIDWVPPYDLKEIWPNCVGTMQPGASHCLRGKWGDVVGDAREEVLWYDAGSDTFRIATNIEDNDTRRVTPLADRGYRAFVARFGVYGYIANWLPARSGQARHDLIEAAPGSCAGRSAGEVCRSPRGDCDLAEVCDGVSDQCPADTFRAAGTVCRSSTAGCDPAEACDGSSPGCPPDDNGCVSCTPGACASSGGTLQADPGRVFVDSSCNQAAPTASIHCGTGTACTGGACTGTRYYRACDGAGACRTDNTGAATEPIHAASCQVLDTSCNSVAPGLGLFCGSESTVDPGDYCTCHIYFRGCDGSGVCLTDNTCATHRTQSAPSGQRYVAGCYTEAGDCP